MARILIAGFCALPGPNRVGVQLRHVVKSLRTRAQVDVLVTRTRDQAYVERYGAARLLRVPVGTESAGSQVASYQRALRRQLEGADYDVVMVRDGWAAEPVLEMAPRLGYAIVFDAARSPLSEPSLLDLDTAQRLARLEEDCIRRADLVLAPSEASRPYLASLAKSELIHVVPPGVDVDAFDWEDAPPIPGASPIILFLGSLSPGRGVRVLLRAMLDVAQHSNAVLVLAGHAEPAFRQSLESGISDLGLSQHVELAGEVAYSAAPSVIARATVCVAPGAIDLSTCATALYPTKILEYMACQRAVIAPRRSSVTMMMRDGQHGLLFDPGQPGDLANKILLLLGDPEARERLALAGYDLVRRVHTASATRRAMTRAFDFLAAQPKLAQRLEAARDERVSDAAGAVTPSLEAPDIGEGSRHDDSDTVIISEDDSGVRIIDDVTHVELQPPVETDAEGDTAGESTGVWMSEASEIGSTKQRIGNDFVAGEVEVAPPRPERPEPTHSVKVSLALDDGEAPQDDTDELLGQARLDTSDPTRLAPLVKTVPTPERRLPKVTPPGRPPSAERGKAAVKTGERQAQTKVDTGDTRTPAK